MASVNFKKLKNRGAVRAIIQHCDKEERLRHEHRNRDIDKTKTANNLTFYPELDYKATMQRFKDRIAYLDNTTNTNKRKDRTEAFALNIPIPVKEGEALDYRNIMDDVMGVVTEFVGSEDNIINAYLHADEIHDYIDPTTHEKRTSLAHIHTTVIPEINGRLLGKQFSSKTSMRTLNKALDDMFREKYNIRFLQTEIDDPNRLPDAKSWENRGSVEDMKIASHQTLRKDLKELKSDIERMHDEKTELLNDISRVSDKKYYLETEIDSMEQKYNSDKQKYAKLEQEYDKRIEAIKANLAEYKQAKDKYALDHEVERIHEQIGLSNRYSEGMETLTESYREKHNRLLQDEYER